MQLAYSYVGGEKKGFLHAQFLILIIPPFYFFTNFPNNSNKQLRTKFKRFIC